MKMEIEKVEISRQTANAVLKNFKRFDKLVKEFTHKGIPNLDFSTATDEEKETFVRILKRTITRMKKSIRYIQEEKRDDIKEGV